MNQSEQISLEKTTLTLKEQFELLNGVDLDNDVYKFYGGITSLDAAIDYIHFLEQRLKK